MSRPLTGSVRRRGDTWWARLPAATGSTRRWEERFATEREARTWLQRAVAAIKAGTPVPDPTRRPAPPAQVAVPEGLGSQISPEVASVANAWMTAVYDDLRRAGPERADQVRRVVDTYLLPWFSPRTTTIADITYFMAHEWLMHLVGRCTTTHHTTTHHTARNVHRRPDDQSVPARSSASMRAGEVGLAEAARMCGLSVPTLRRRWRDGLLPGAYRNPEGHIRVPARTLGQVTGAGRRAREVGLSKRVVADALWILRRIIAFARANGLFPPGFDPTEGLEAPKPNAVTARTRTPTSQPRPLTLAECARIASHLHPVHQLAFWLQRIMGLRIGEAFGLTVGDIVDLGGHGMLAVQGQGGRTFHVRDDTGTIVAADRKPTMKTAAGSRVLVAPTALMDLMRVAVEAFHTDPDTGTVDRAARLVPGIGRADRGGQVGYQIALTEATKAEHLSSADLGFRVSSHLLRKSVATDLAWEPSIDATVRRRFMGHWAGDDVYGRIYTLDHPHVAPLTKIAATLDTNIATTIGTLLTPTARTVHWATTNPLHARAAHIAAVLVDAGWLVEPGDPDDPLWDATQVASELGIVATTARRWMTDGTLPSVVMADGNGVPRRYSRMSQVTAHQDRQAGIIRLPDLADQLGVRYDEIYRTMRHLDLTIDQHPTNGHFTLTDTQADALRTEHHRVRALHQRSMKLTAAARQLKVSLSTVRALTHRGDLRLDAETDTSGARFVTRASVDACWLARNETKTRKTQPVATVPFAEVVRFTGLGRRAVVDLVRQGVLQQRPGRRATCEITTASLEAWLATAHHQDRQDKVPPVSP